MRIHLSTDLKTRTGAPDKDARLKNAYVEVKDEQTMVRKRPIAQGGVAVGAGTAQGMIGFNIAGVDKLIGVWGDTLTNYTGGGTNWNGGTSYVTGDHVSYGFQDYWATTDHSGSQPPSANWSSSYVPAVPASPYATWNPSDNDGVTLSGGNLVTTHGSGSGLIRSTIFKTTGKWYWEYTITTFVTAGEGDTLRLGVATNAATITNQLGQNAFGWGYCTGVLTPSPQKRTNNTGESYGSAYIAGDVIGVALDMTAGTLEFYKNGVSQGSAYSGLTGNMYASVSGTPNPSSPVVTANFGASAFAYSVPSGYNSGLYT